MTKKLLTPEQRWEQGTPHHKKSLEFKALVDKIQDQEDYAIEFGGDGDEGEIWLYMLDEFFENQDDNTST